MKKRILGMVLCVCMVLSLITVAAFADEHVYRVAGEPELCGSPWVTTDDDNRMTYNGETGRYEKVYTDVAAGPIPGYLYKIVVDGATWIPDGSGPNPTVYVEEDNATVTIWYDENTGEYGADVAYDTPAEPPAPSLVRGDIDFDGVVTVKDAIMLQDCLENPESLEKLTSEQYEAADFNGDGVVTESDLTALRSFLNPITINGPDVVCAQQDYEFTVTASEGVEFDDGFGFDTGSKGSGVDLTIDENGVGHGVMLTEWYDLNTNYFDLSVYGYTEDEQLVSGTKRVQVSPEHIYVDGVCGCGAKSEYTITYDGGEGVEGSIPAGVKARGEAFTLSSDTFTREGFVQTGWVDESGAIYDLGGDYMLDEDMTFYPYWEKLITLTVPYTTTVALGDAGEPGETTFDLALVGSGAGDYDAADVTVSGTVTTDGAGDYNSTLAITGPEWTLWHLLSEGAFVQQVDAGADGWTVDDTVWGLLMSQAAALSDDAAAGYTLLVVPASVDEFGNYGIDWNLIDWEDPQSADMTFTNTYTAHAYELNHDADGHWDECAGCDDKQNAEPHQYGDWKVTKEATEKEAGEKEHTCTVCGYTEKAEIAKLPATTDPTNPDTKPETKPETKPATGTVQTGDDGFLLWAALFVTSGTLLAVLAPDNRRKKRVK